jgi:hypothetical protein
MNRYIIGLIAVLTACSFKAPEPPAPEVHLGAIHVRDTLPPPDTTIVIQLLAPAPTIQDVKLGMTYNEVKSGPCPDIVGAIELLSPGFPVYYCPSLKLRIIGSRYTGKVVGILLWDEIKRGTGTDSVTKN